MRKLLFRLTTVAVCVLAYIQLSAKKYTNFILILMDDMGYGDIRANGAVCYPTPNIDKLAREGMLFTRFYAAQAVSGASRAGILTGCYPNRIGMSGAPFPGSDEGISNIEKTIPELLKQRGYVSAAFGKWHLGDALPFLPLMKGFDEYFGIPYSNDMYPGHPTYKFPDLPLIEGDKVVELNPDQSKFTTNFTERAVAFIEKNRKKPFFLYLAHPMPHVPLAVSDKFKGKSGMGLYGDVMMELDWSIGRVMESISRYGLDENTLVVITSDNGPWLNYGNHAGSAGGLREGKGTSFEGGQRVPCIMRWKGVIPAASVCSNLASGLDLLPTFAAIAAADLPDHKIDGVNLMPLLLQQPGANPRQSFFYYYRANDLEAVTDGNFKLVFPHNYRTYENNPAGMDGKPGKVDEFHPLKERLLFDLRRDPGERYNVIEHYPDELAKLEKMALDAREDLGDNLTNIKGKGVRQVGKLPGKNR